MRSKICLVTGTTSGIGKATALGLARLGATVVLVSRTQAKGEATRAYIRETTGNDRIDLLVADLSSQSDVRRLADEFTRRHDRQHVLINNAGGFQGSRRVTVNGLELTFALNHLAYFLLTHLLLDVLKASAPARIVNVTSGAQSVGRINFENLQGEKRYRPQAAYSQSKLANVLFTYELARRLAGTGVTANAVHPGAVRTNFGRENSTPFMALMVRLAWPFMLTPEKGAETSIYLASSPEVEGVTGKYFVKKHTVPSSPRSYDLDVARRLWEVSTRLTDVAQKAQA